MEIERRAGKSIARIFAEDGEPAFRDLEAAGDRRPLPPAAAGPGGRRRGAAAGGKPPGDARRRQVVWLTARPETILARMSGDATTAAPPAEPDRQGPLEEIVHLLGRREPIYRESAHLAIDTEGKTPEQLAAEILAQLGLRISSEAN